MAVAAAAVASMVLGFLWYGPLFGKQWMSMMGIVPDPSKMQGMWKTYMIAFVASLVTAYVLTHSIVFGANYLHLGGPTAGLMAGFWIWLGFVAPVTLGSVLWESKPWGVWFLNNGYHLVNLLIMGGILGWWM
jgi:hypothetical protein